jgi:signal transduction histidine kinase|nr:histidine kinase [Aeromicrobium sp.]
MTSSVRTVSPVDREIHRYGLLDREPRRDLQSLVDLVAAICEVSCAAISTIGTVEQREIVAHGFEPSVYGRGDSICAVVMDEPGLVVVPDASRDPRFADDPRVTGRLGAIRFYASVPVLTPEGVLIGRLCVFDEAPRELTPVQQKALGIMAGQITDLLALRFRSRALETSLVELTTVRDELRRSNEHLTQFAGQISHDLRTPLTAILINAEMLASEPVVEGDADVSAMVGAVSKAGHRMDALIEEMLSYAREGGRLRMVETDVAQVVGKVLADIAPLVRRDDADIRLGELPHLQADPELLYSVVLNLLTNAIKFARPGTRPTVWITADRLSEHWRVWVTDDGIGVPEDRQAAMFELFSRADDGTAGHGIGLATARRIVEAHGGTIGMQTPAAGGTSVWFDLPV